jgi:hypothetical protein
MWRVTPSSFYILKRGIRSPAREELQKADSYCKILVSPCKMTCNRAEMSSFVSGKLSYYHLFSCTSPEVPSFLTSLRGARFPPRDFYTLSLDAKEVANPLTGTGATPIWTHLALHGTAGAAEATDQERS